MLTALAREGKLLTGHTFKPMTPLEHPNGKDCATLVKGASWVGLMLAIQIETVIGIMVVLNLVGLTIAAYRIMKRK